MAGKKLHNRAFIHVIDALVSDLHRFIKRLLIFLNLPFIINMTKEISISISPDATARKQLAILGYDQKKIGYIVLIPVKKSSIVEDLEELLSISSNLKSDDRAKAQNLEKKINSMSKVIIRLFLRRDLPQEFIFLLRNFILTET